MIEELTNYFSCKRKVGWTAICTKDGNIIDGFRTDRIAKIMAGGELQITVGSNEPGRSANLNKSVVTYIESQGINTFERKSTSGSSPVERLFPSIDTAPLDSKTVTSILLEIEKMALAVGRGESVDSETASNDNSVDTSRATDIYRQFRSHITSEKALDAFKCLLDCGGSMQKCEMESKAGQKKDVRFYDAGEATQPFAFIVNRNNLLFYLRKPAVMSGKYSLSGLREIFGIVDENKIGEWTIRIASMDTATDICDQILEVW